MEVCHSSEEASNAQTVSQLQFHQSSIIVTMPKSYDNFRLQFGGIMYMTGDTSCLTGNTAACHLD